MPHERERASGSREKQTLKTFLLSLKLLFNIGDLYQKNDYYHSAAQVSVGDANLWLCLLVTAVN